MQDLADLINNAVQEIKQAKDLQSLDDIRVEYLGKKGKVTGLLKNLGALPKEQRPAAGQAVNVAKVKIQDAILAQRQLLEDDDLRTKINAEQIDVTLPARGLEQGSLHPVSKVSNRIQEFFVELGFDVVEGPEIEDDYHNFEALNIPEHHPARAMQDTFYFGDGRVLRTHTSPVQIRSMEKSSPPFRLIAPGRVYRCDSDLTHTPMFHQVEGLMVGEGIGFAHLKSVLIDFLQVFFEQDLQIRFRPSYFPFTEPSAEVDMQCSQCLGAGCRICSNTGWLEILGCGMVHPVVLENCNIDSEVYTGWAFGIGMDRLAMLRYKIPDLRMLFENDLKFLAQF